MEFFLIRLPSNGAEVEVNEAAVEVMMVKGVLNDLRMTREERANKKTEKFKRVEVLCCCKFPRRKCNKERMIFGTSRLSGHKGIYK